MIEKKDLLISYLSWILCFLICMAVGIYRTYALTFSNFQYIQNNTQLLVGYADSGNPVSWPYNNSGLYQENIVSLDYIISNINISANVHYEFESHMLSQRIIGSPTYTVTGLNGESCLTDSYYLNFINSEYPRWDFQCPHATDTFTIHIYQPNNSKLFNSGYMGWGSAILSQADTTINSSGNDTEEIINNQNKNANDIIDNQNKNTEDIINSAKSCRIYDKSSVETYFKYLDSNGDLRDSIDAGVSKYINVFGGTLEKLSNSGNTPSICFYNVNKTLLTCRQNQNVPIGNINLPDNTYYVRFSIYTNVNRPQYKVCKNGNQGVSDSINDLNDTLTDTNVDTSELNNVVGWLPQGPVDSIITLPLNLFNAYSSALGLTCSTLNLPLPFVNKTLPIPCLRSLLTSIGIWTWWNNFGYLIAGIILYNYLLNLYKWVDDTLTLRENTMPGYYDDKFGGGA